MMKRVRDFLWSNTDKCEGIETLRDKMSRLSAQEADIRIEIENAERQPGKRRKEEVNYWLNEVEKKKGEVINIEKEYQQWATSCQSQLSCRIERLTEVVLELIQQGRFPNGPVVHDDKMRAVEFPMSRMVGEMFQKNFETIMGWLGKSKPLIIGIHGMGGVGKTTLLKYIHNHLPSNSGWLIHWVTVSDDCDVYKLQQKIFHVITGKIFYEEDKETRSKMLHYTLEKMGKLVLILDDLWKAYMVDEIGIPLGENNCKIILSSRSLEVCRRMGCEEFSVKVKPLSESEAWELFVEKLQNYKELDAEVKLLATLVAKQCCYLPLAIRTIAVSMRGVSDAFEWRNALNELKNPIIRRHDTGDDVFATLKFSYDRLNDKMMQTCFLTCVLHPEDSEIPREKLINYWIVEGLLNGMESWEDKRNKGHSILNKLVNSGLLEETTDWENYRCVKMHDLIRDMGIIITQSHPRFMAKSGLLLKEVPHEDHWTEELVKVSLSHNRIAEIVIPESPRCPKLSVLMLDNSPLTRIPESFFLHMRALTILDMSYTNIQRLPDSMCDLENLRGLFLQHCNELKYVPSLSKQTKLTELDLYNCGKMAEAPRGLESLTFLRKLSIAWDVNDMPYLKRLGESRHFSKMNIYDIWLADWVNLEWFPNEVHEMEDDFDRKVLISGKDFKQPISTLFIPNTVEYLKIFGFDMKDKGSTLGDIMPLLCQATELIQLVIKECSGVGYISSGNHEGSFNFDKLEKFKILTCWEMPDLKGLIEYGRGNKAHLLSSSPHFTHRFTQLEELSISWCNQLKVVFPQELLQRQLCLPNLKWLCVNACEEVEEIFESPWNNPHYHTVDGVSSMNLILNLPKLMKLELSWLPKVRSIYKGLICAPLKRMEVHNCAIETFKGPYLRWDESLFDLDSTYLNSPPIWQHLERNHPEDAIKISVWMENRRSQMNM